MRYYCVKFENHAIEIALIRLNVFLDFHEFFDGW